jgi:hypothetical protein
MTTGVGRLGEETTMARGIQRLGLLGTGILLVLALGLNASAGTLNAGGTHSGETHSGENHKNEDLTGIILWNGDLSLSNLSGVDFTNAQLLFTDLTGSNLKNANFTGADLRFADLTNVELKDAVLTGADVASADLSGVLNWSTIDWTGVVYDLATVFPTGMNPVTEGMVGEPALSLLGIVGLAAFSMRPRRKRSRAMHGHR